jgi:hypothetical protein
MNYKKSIIFGSSEHETIASKLVELSTNQLENLDTEFITESDFLEEDIDNVVNDTTTKIVFFTISDFEKVKKFRKKRKDIFLIAVNYTYDKTELEQYLSGLNLCKKASVNLVLQHNVSKDGSENYFIITPEEAKYHETGDVNDVLFNLVDMSKLRSHLTFTRSTVISGEPVSWDSEEVFPVLKQIVDHCITRCAYKPFNGATVGHFACKIGENTFLTSIRKSNFNDIDKNGLVKVVTDSDDTVLAYGAKPSVGGQSQRLIFNQHEDLDCIVHFHCPIKPESLVPIKSQREYECGSHQCGQNTSDGLMQFGNLKAVYLDQHGPNIVFNHNIDPQEVIDFIEENFDLEDKTGGPVQSDSEQINLKYVD